MKKYDASGQPTKKLKEAIKVSSDMVKDRFYLSWKQQRVVLVNHGKLMYSVKNYKEAIKHYTQALKVAGFLDSESNMRLGLSYFYEKEYEEAIKYLEKANSDRELKRDVNIAEYLGDAYYNTGRGYAYDNARKNYKLALMYASDEEDIGILKKLINIYDELKYYKEMEETVLQLLKLEDDYIYWFQLGYAQSLQGKCEQALLAYMQSAGSEGRALEKVYNNIAVCYFDKKQYKTAVDYYDKALEVKPDHINALDGKARTLKEMGEHAKAYKMFNQLLEMDPKNEERYIYELKSIVLRNTFGTDKIPDPENSTYEERKEFADALAEHIVNNEKADEN
jgi:tetratricopeptide (TPR) repeat protein